MNFSRIAAFLLLLLIAAVRQTAGLTIKPLAGSNRRTTNNNNNNNNSNNANHRNKTPLPSRNTPIKASVATEIQEARSTNLVIEIYNQYLNWIDRQPVLAKSITAAVIGSIGDIMAQWLESRSAGVHFLTNWVRVSAFFACGLFFVGPYLHVWYEQLWAIGRYLNNNVTKNKKFQTFAQVFVDQTLGVVIFFPTYFYAFELAEAFVSLRAPAWSLATEKVTNNLASVIAMQYRVWPLVGLLNFSFVPERMRVLTSNVVSIFWNAYFCTRVA